MSTKVPIINKEIQDYLNEYYQHLNTPAVQKLADTALANLVPDIQISIEQAAFLQWIIRTYHIKDALEIGTLIGYSTYIMAQAMMDDGHITTIEKNSRFLPIAKEFWEKSSVSNKIEQRLGLAEDIIEDLLHCSRKFDLIFIDADKLNYGLYFETGLKLLSDTGLMLIDNMFAFGRINEKDFSTPEIEVIRKLNDKIKHDDRILNLLLPLGDGLTLIQKKGNHNAH
jgi:O-methyltransferase